MDSYDEKIERRLKPKDGSLDVLADRINELKSLFKQEYEQNEDLYDKRDYDRFMDTSDDWHARRWIIYQRDVSIAFEMLKDTMRWRKEMDLNNLSYEDFPREFFECGCVFEYGHDKKGSYKDFLNTFARYTGAMRRHKCTKQLISHANERCESREGCTLSSKTSVASLVSSLQ